MLKSHVGFSGEFSQWLFWLKRRVQVKQSSYSGSHRERVRGWDRQVNFSVWLNRVGSFVISLQCVAVLQHTETHIHTEREPQASEQGDRWEFYCFSHTDRLSRREEKKEIECGEKEETEKRAVSVVCHVVQSNSSWALWRTLTLSTSCTSWSSGQRLFVTRPLHPSFALMSYKKPFHQKKRCACF